MRASANLLLALAAASCVPAPTEEHVSAIHNGQATAAYPAVVGVALARSSCGTPFVPQCTGVLIAPRVVLTAAHCVLAADVDTFEVFFGSDVAAGGVFQRGTARRHPAYDPSSATRAYDFGVIVLDQPSPVAPLAMRTTPLAQTDVGAQVTLVGFGIVAASTTPDGLKRTGDAQISTLGAIDMQLSPAPSSSCDGDSGGPVLLAEQLVGVTSWGDGACQSFSVAGLVNAALADFLTPILEQVAAPPPPRAALTEGTNLCSSPCAGAADCPIGTLCLQGSCMIPGFGQGIVGGACSEGDGCQYCLRVSDSDPCRCVHSCATQQGSGCTVTAASPSGSGSLLLGILAMLYGRTRCRRTSHVGYQSRRC